MKEEEIIEQAKRWIRARSGTIELREHFIQILSEKFNNPEEVLALLLKKGLAKEDGKWIDLINIFKGIRANYEEEEEE
jgi:hypothetical protein